jgi:hypothetical protein
MGFCAKSAIHDNNEPSGSLNVGHFLSEFYSFSRSGCALQGVASGQTDGQALHQLTTGYESVYWKRRSLWQQPLYPKRM